MTLVLLITACRVSATPTCPADISPSGGDKLVDIDDLLLVINSWGSCIGCAADIVPISGNGVVNIDDLLLVIDNWGACPPSMTGACSLPDHTCVINTEAQCTAAKGLGWVGGAACIDSDADRIPDAFELNNCSAASLAFVGTNPALADTDGDRINDGDEFYGTLGGLNLPALGANPLRKNALIEIDWFDEAEGGLPHSHRPTNNAITLIRNAFTNSPVTNICGGTGVTLIIDYGQGGAFTGGNMIPGGDTIVLFDSEFNIYKAGHFAANRNGYFHYSIFCHRYNSATNGSSGVAEINGDDFIVSLQNSLSDSNVSKTFLHEFGHNLNLRHGGNENRNYKPNYNSVMNYRFQFPGADSNCNAVGDGILDYSRGLNISLDENSLNEAAGVCGSTPIDWNGGGISPAPIARNINCPVGISNVCGTQGSCNDSTCNVLSDHNDWAAISFSGIIGGDFAPPQVIHCDAPRDMVRDP